MVIFGSRGSFAKAKIDASKGQGARLKLPSGDIPAANNIVTGIQVSQTELIGVQQCLNKAVYVYAFGHDPNGSSLVVDVTMFLGCDNDSGLAKHISNYKSGRISTSKQEGTLTVGGASMSGYLTAQHVTTASAELNMFNVSYTFTLLRPA